MSYSPFWPRTRVVRSANNCFNWNTGEPSVFRPLQSAANLRAASTRNVEQARANGTDRSTLHGISKKADAIVAQRRRYSPMVEGAAAGQAAAEKRRRASKADI